MSSTRKASSGLANLARVLGVQKTTPVTAKKKIKAAAGKATPVSSDRTEQIAVKLPMALAKRMREAVYFVPGLTVTGLVASAVAAELDRLEAKHGGPFGEAGPVKRGRPARR